LYLDAPLGVLKKSTRSSRCPLRKNRSTPHNEVGENDNICGQRSDNKQILTPAAKLPRAAGKEERGAARNTRSRRVQRNCSLGLIA
jgi:hypothetical protein